jgi:uncharacterized protein (DUF2132 family)
MNLDVNYKNNPLHRVSLKSLLIEIVDHYGYAILFAYLNINCFKSNPSIDSSVKFLKKTEWAREKVEAFYLYQFKNLPKASPEQFELTPRERVIPEHQTPSKPVELSLEDAEQLQLKRAQKAESYNRTKNRERGINTHQDGWSTNRSRNDARQSNSSDDSDPWAKWRK